MKVNTVKTIFLNLTCFWRLEEITSSCLVILVVVTRFCCSYDLIKENILQHKTVKTFNMSQKYLVLAVTSMWLLTLGWQAFLTLIIFCMAQCCLLLYLYIYMYVYFRRIISVRYCFLVSFICNVEYCLQFQLLFLCIRNNKL